MSLQVEIQAVDGATFAVPWPAGDYHLDSNADVWLYRIPGTTGTRLPEYVVSSLRQFVWPDIWVVTIVTRDLPGVLGRIGGFLGSLDINIVSMTSCTIEHSQYHSTRLIVDCRRYNSSPVDRTSDTRIREPRATLNQLKRALIVEFILDIAPPPYPSVSIDRSLAFWSLHRECRAGQTSHAETRLTPEAGRVALPRVEVDRLAGTPNALQSTRLLVTTDQSAGLVRLVPFRAGAGIVSVSLSTTNTPGAIAAIATCLGQANVNILAAKAWTSWDNERTSVWLLLRHWKAHADALNDDDAKLEVMGFLNTDPDLAQFKVRVGFS